MGESTGKVSEQPFRSAVRNVHTEGIFGVDPDGTVASWNDGAVRIFGDAEDEAVGRPLSAFVVGPDAVPQLLGEARETGESEVEHRYCHDDGTERWIRTAISTVEDDGHLVGFLAVVRDATERRERERTIRDQRSELDALDHVHRLVAELVRQLAASTRLEDLEATVCERLVELPFYESAWVGERSADGTLSPRAGTGGRERPPAVAEREPDDSRDAQTTGVSEDGDVFAAPVRYGETDYGVLVVRSSRDDAFGERERTALETLAETVGFAVQMLKREQLLFADAVVELEFEVIGSDSEDADPNAVFTALAERHDCRCRVEDVVRGFDGESRQFLTIDGASPDDVRETLEDLRNVEEYRITGGDEPFRLELRVAFGDFLDEVVETGTDVQSAIATPDGSRFVLETVPETIDDLERLVEEAFSEWRLVRKKTADGSTQAADTEDRSVEEVLTEKQLTALRTAYLTGYYDYPRKSTAEEVADDLDITGVTLFQHLQAAQRKLIEACLY